MSWRIFEQWLAGMRVRLRWDGRIIEAYADRFEWGRYGTPADRAQLRRGAGDRFLADLRRHPERYLCGALPTLPLADACVDLVLCSHMLFTWADQPYRRFPTGFGAAHTTCSKSTSLPRRRSPD